MDLNAFQKAALETDNTDRHYEAEDGRKDVVVAILGVAGELGTLATAYKKFLRDGPAYEPYRDNVREELGDLLWYVAVLANKFGLTLSDIAESNLQKTRGRWGTTPEVDRPPYDLSFPPGERLPRKFTIKFEESETEQGTRLVMRLDGETIGNSLSDNSTEEDGYRFHDAFHLAFAVTLGWSPVFRKLAGKKRRSNRTVDETQDGGRAIVIEEGIVAYVFEYGVAHNELAGVHSVDFEVLKTVKSMSHRLEVGSKSWSDWERAIKAGFYIFRQLKQHRRGFVDCDLDAQTIEFREG